MAENDAGSTPDGDQPRNTWNYEVPDGRLVRGDLPTDPGEDRSTDEPAPPPPAAPPEPPAGSASETVIVPTPASAPPPGAGPPPMPRGAPTESGGVSRRLVALVWLVAFVVAGAAVILLLTRDDGDRVVAVPDLTDVDEETARELLDELGLTLGAVSGAPGAPGVVVSQDPPPGAELSPGETVDLAIGGGGDGTPGGSGELIDLPDVVGQTEEEARQTLAAAGATDVSVNAVESSEPAGTVLGQDPAPGRAAAGAPVVLTVAAAPGDVPVPDVGGLAVGEAEALLGAAGFDVEIVEASSDAVATGGLIGTDPAAGSAAPPGSVVRLLVSTGPESVIVPDVVGQNALEGSGALRAEGLTVTTTVCQLSDADADQAGLVVEQTPPGGTQVDPGVEVSVCVGAAPEPTPTPVPTATPRPRPTATPRPAPTATPRPAPTSTPPPDCPIDDETCR